VEGIEIDADELARNVQAIDPAIGLGELGAGGDHDVGGSEMFLHRLSSAARAEALQMRGGDDALTRVVVTPSAPDFSRKGAHRRCAIDRAAADQQQRTLRAVDQLRRGFEIRFRAFGPRAVDWFRMATSAGAASTSSGYSSTTGRGRLVSNTSKASETAFAISLESIHGAGEGGQRWRPTPAGR